MIAPHSTTPRVSVLMSTYGHAPFIRRAIESLLAQTMGDWELLIVDDGSADDTRAMVTPYLADPRLRYTRLERNGGLGAALNAGTAMARGRSLAYLPSDDLYYPEHLAHLTEILDARPEVYLAYGGLRYGYQRFGPLHQQGGAEGPQAPSQMISAHPGNQGLTSLKLVQVLHRREHERLIRWPVRAERESDDLEGVMLAGLARLGDQAYAGEISCEWLDHADQRTKLLIHHTGGLSLYRARYGLGRGEWVTLRSH